MRYHWGLAVGHVYAHGQNAHSATTPTVRSNSTESTIHRSSNAVTIQNFDEEECDIDRPDLDDDDDDWEDVDCFGDNDGQVVDDFSDDDMAVSMFDMYGEE
jgi:hypothetical protein